MSSLLSSLSVSFSDNADSDAVLTIENYQQVPVGLGSLAVAVRDTMTEGTRVLYATAGTIQDVNLVVDKTIDASFLQVDGVIEANIPAEATYEILFSLDSDGNPISGVYEQLRVRNVVKFNRPFYGLIKINEYTVPVHIYKYTPGSRITTSLVSTAFGVTVTYGTVAVYRHGKLAMVDIVPPTVNTGNDELEVYRVESKVLINSEGEWEMPSGWPDNPSYPTGAIPPKARVGVVSTRVHEIGMVTAEGYFYSRAYDVTPQKPYFGDRTYVPEKSVVAGSGMSKLTPAMQAQAQEAMAARGKKLV